MKFHLDCVLPIKRDEWELVAWFYGLPDYQEILQLMRRRASTKSGRCCWFGQRALHRPAASTIWHAADRAPGGAGGVGRQRRAYCGLTGNTPEISQNKGALGSMSDTLFR